MTTTGLVTSPARSRRFRIAAVGAAVLVNSALYLSARAAGTDFKLTDPASTQFHALVLPEIVAFTLIFALLGWSALALLERFARHARGIWSALAVSVLLLSYVPIALETTTVDTRIMLTLIHTAVAAALFPMLRRS
jgi:hypothetical protein